MSENYRIRRLRIRCPDAASIEETLLRARTNPLSYRVFEQHMITCPRCQRIVKRIKVFYDILTREMIEPKSAKIIDFAKDIEAGVKPE